MSPLKKGSTNEDSFMSHLVMLRDKNHLKAVSTKAIREMCQTFPLPLQHVLEEVHGPGMHDAAVDHLLPSPLLHLRLRVSPSHCGSRGSKQNWNLLQAGWKNESRRNDMRLEMGTTEACNKKSKGS